VCILYGLGVCLFVCVLLGSVHAYVTSLSRTHTHKPPLHWFLAIPSIYSHTHIHSHTHTIYIHIYIHTQVSGFAPEGRILSSQAEFVSVERLLASEKLAGRTVGTYKEYKGLIAAVEDSTGDVAGVVFNILNSNTQVCDSSCVCVRVHIFMYVCVQYSQLQHAGMRFILCVRACIYICMCVFVYIFMYICMCVFVYIYICMCGFVYMCECVCTYIHDNTHMIHTHTHTHIHTHTGGLVTR
jgi:hypothetical protein